MSNHALFAVTPYLAAFALVAVTLLRYLLARQRGGLTADQASTARAIFGRHRAWSLGLGGLAVAHGVLLALPGRWVLAWNQSLPRLLALEAAFFAFGVGALVGLLALIARQADPRVRVRSSWADAAFLGLLVVEILSGLSLAILYRWASSWSVVTLTPYLHSLLSFEPRLSLVQALPYLVKLHVFAGMALLALLPFTHLVYRLLVPLDRALAFLLTPLQRAAHHGRRRLEEAVRVGGRRLGWREEED